jgi:YggT family protein
VASIAVSTAGGALLPGATPTRRDEIPGIPFAHLTFGELTARSHLRRGHSMTSGRKHAVIAGLLGFVLVLFQLVLVARIVVDWVGVLSPATAGGGLYQARRITHGITEPVIAPVRRVLKPVRVGSVGIDLAFTAVFLAVIILRTVVVPFIPF